MSADVQTTPGDVLIVDDHELVGTSLKLSLRSEGVSAHHCAPAGSDEVLRVAAGLTPGVVLLDLDLGRNPDGSVLDGVRLVAPLCAAGWLVIILSGSADGSRIGAGLAEGAMAWVPKNAPFPTLLGAVRNAAVGREVMPAARRQQFIDTYRQRSHERDELLAKLAAELPPPTTIASSPSQSAASTAVAA